MWLQESDTTQQVNNSNKRYQSLVFLCVFVLLWYQIVVALQNELRNHQKRHLIFFITSVLITESISLLDLISFFLGGGVLGRLCMVEQRLLQLWQVGQGELLPLGDGGSPSVQKDSSAPGAQSPHFPQGLPTHFHPTMQHSHPPKAAPSGQQQIHCQTGCPGCRVISCKSQDKTVLFFSAILALRLQR